VASYLTNPSSYFNSSFCYSFVYSFVYYLTSAGDYVLGSGFFFGSLGGLAPFLAPTLAIAAFLASVTFYTAFTLFITGVLGLL
jgi:hypothetical protein